MQLCKKLLTRFDGVSSRKLWKYVDGFDRVVAVDSVMQDSLGSHMDGQVSPTLDAIGALSSQYMEGATSPGAC